MRGFASVVLVVLGSSCGNAWAQALPPPSPAPPALAGPKLGDPGVVRVHIDSPAPVKLIYKYDVAGVSYECSQDVTYLRHWVNLQSCRLGLPTSVKYDPQNPGNSLVVSETWMGLRQ